MRSRMIVFACMLWVSIAFGQIEPWFCPHSEDEQSEAVAAKFNSRQHNHELNFIEPLPTFDGINFKVAVLYFKDADDDFPPDPSDPAYCRVNSWPKTSNQPNLDG